MYKKISCGYGEATRDGNKFIFFKCMWRKQISIDKFVTNHAFPVVGGRVGNRRGRFWCMDGCIRPSRESWDEGGDPCWPSLSAGTLHSTWDAGGFTICTVEAQLCFVERTCLWKTVELERLRFLMRHRYCHWIQISEETPIRLNTLLNDTTLILTQRQEMRWRCHIHVGPKKARSSECHNVNNSCWILPKKQVQVQEVHSNHKPIFFLS